MRFSKWRLRAALATFGASNFIFAAEGLSKVGEAVDTMCTQLTAVLPVVSMLMVIGAGVVYASGQMMGAETRARANTWATAMLLGALIGVLITVVAPPVLKLLYPAAADDFFCGTKVG